MEGTCKQANLDTILAKIHFSLTSLATSPKTDKGGLLPFMCTRKEKKKRKQNKKIRKYVLCYPSTSTLMISINAFHFLASQWVF